MGTKLNPPISAPKIATQEIGAPRIVAIPRPWNVRAPAAGSPAIVDVLLGAVPRRPAPSLMARPCPLAYRSIGCLGTLRAGSSGVKRGAGGRKRPTDARADLVRGGGPVRASGLPRHEHPRDRRRGRGPAAIAVPSLPVEARHRRGAARLGPGACTAPRAGDLPCTRRGVGAPISLPVLGYAAPDDRAVQPDGRVRGRRYALRP